jgi:SAM-dependent methyltransferase
VTVDKFNLPEQYYPLSMFRDKMDYHFIDSVDIREHYEDKSFDVIYIDGDHKMIPLMKDLQNAKKLIKDGGYICGHDYNKISWMESVMTIESFFGREPDKVYDDSSWVYKI